MKMKKWPLLVIVLLLTSCSGKEATGGQIDYEETKKMVVDILKTDDGKKAIQDVMSDDKLKEKLVMDQKVVSETIEKTLTSDKGTTFWKKSFEDPKFSASVAKSMKKENEKLLKDLMKDPEYRGMMMEIFKEPELQKDMADALKSKEFRQHLQKVMTETFESPIFKAKIQALLIKAAEEIQAGKSTGKDSSGGEDSGNQGQEPGAGA